MKVTLRVHKVCKTIDYGSPEAEKNDVAIALENLILQVVNLDSLKDIWDAIKARHLGEDRVRETRLQTLMSEFEYMRMKDSETIDTFAGKI